MGVYWYQRISIGHNLLFVQKKFVVFHVLSAAIPRGMWAKVLEQTLLVILIMGRWILPKGTNKARSGRFYSYFVDWRAVKVKCILQVS
jgi:hypothetical protein